MQPASITAGSALSIALSYQDPNKQNGADNGNVFSEAMTRAGSTWSQAFGYDGVNRLSTATETGGSNEWSQSYGYDAYGNRWVSGGYIQDSAFTPQAQSNFDGGNHLLIQNTAYDNAGNQTTKGGYTFAYDSEGRIESSTISGAATVYLYDAEDHRVMKQSPSGSSVYVYDLQGDVAAEFDSGADQITEPCVTCYVAVDHLGSIRAIIDAASGNVMGCHDYLPFGEEIVATVGGRSGNCWDAMDTTMRFTGKERDQETANSASQGLDYFGARYFSGAQGRFTSPDGVFVDQHAGDPQSWNLYGYVRNNPLRFVDFYGDKCGSNGIDDQTQDACFTVTAHASLFGRFLSSVGSFLKSAGTEATVNTFIDTANTFDKMRQMTYGGPDFRQPRIEPTTSAGQYGQLAGTIVPFLIPGFGEADSLKILSEVDRLSIVKPNVTNPELAELVEELFQAADKVPGGTAGAVRYERMTGDLLSPAGHAQDARELIVRINKFLRTNPGISLNDQRVAKGLILDLQNAVAGK